MQDIAKRKEHREARHMLMAVRIFERLREHSVLRRHELRRIHMKRYTQDLKTPVPPLCDLKRSPRMHGSVRNRPV